MKRVIIVHGWVSNPLDCWFPWLRKELKKRGFDVIVPLMPSPLAPKIVPWVARLRRAVGTPDRNTIFVGHSIGCQTILRYLATLPPKTRIGGLVCVAGFFKLQNLETAAERRIARPWTSTASRINTKKIRRMTPKVVGIFSDNDPWVSLSNARDLKRRLGARVIVEHGKGHFTLVEDGITRLPSALRAVLALART